MERSPREDNAGKVEERRRWTGAKAIDRSEGDGEDQRQNTRATTEMKVITGGLVVHLL